MTSNQTQKLQVLGPALWQIAFRPFFLIPSIFICFALSLWGLLLTNHLPDSLAQYQPYSGWIGWHSHEMIFGFVQAVAIGFLLTASRNWASQPGISARFLKLLVCTWVLARVAWLIPTTPTLVIILLDVSTPLLAALGLAQTLANGEKDNGKGSQKHNWPFVLLLTAFALVQLIFHILYHQQPQYMSLLMQIAVLMMAAMTLWVSGRVLPFFTKAKLQIAVTPLPKGLKTLSMSASWVLIPIMAASVLASNLIDPTVSATTTSSFKILIAVFAIIAAVGHAITLSIMFKPGVIKEPMLWSLYLSYIWIIVGFCLLALSQFYSTTLPWLHAITIGGLTGMIISMMARVGLGHTGRKILALRGMIWAFTFIQLAALVRIFITSNIGFVLSIGLLLITYTIFLYHYTSILLKPRADGRPG